MKYKLISNRNEREWIKINKSLSIANEALALFGKREAFDVNLFEAYPDMDSLIRKLEMEKNGNPKKIYFVQSLKLWLFGEHKFFYICLRLQQLMNLAPTDNLTIINWDQHEDLYPESDFVKFQRYGNPDNFNGEQSLKAVDSLIYHQFRNVGIASFPYPFIWDDSLKNMIWRRNSKFRFNGVERESFGFDYREKDKLFNQSRKATSDRSLDFYNLGRSMRSSFKRVLSHLSDTHFIHTTDMDSFYEGFCKRVSKTRIRIFLKDLDIIINQPAYHPIGVFIATSPGIFTNEKTIVGLTYEVLAHYKTLETAIIDNKK
ncbi:MAG: hypothetical protein A2Y40_09620 [Candidatus Margulisbacteria bacterium GWF2_35_9]|nr:MAG: hypothetical protein A2Y40_09620 [Candidatus Margulisbacteria bacterium GWF2_35_9]